MMSTYFKPLRRKLGVVTLLMACVFAAAWIRSLNSGDFLFLEFEFPIGGRIAIASVHSFASRSAKPAVDISPGSLQ